MGEDALWEKHDLFGGSRAISVVNPIRVIGAAG